GNQRRAVGRVRPGRRARGRRWRLHGRFRQLPPRVQRLRQAQPMARCRQHSGRRPDTAGSLRTDREFDHPQGLLTGNVRAASGVDGSVRLSVLDLVPVRTDQTTSDALAATVRLAQTADRLGFTRYWVAEHHNMPSVGATSAPELIAYLAAQTAQLRLGSGGVMLTNHAPLAVAEQFALLEAAAPGRIDLGIGRAPGSDPVTSVLLRRPAGRDDRHIDQFPQYLDHVRAMMSARGVPVQLRGGDDYILKAVPAAASEPLLWLLGSSMSSAQLAAAKGLPYVFAHHFSGQGTEEALALYRSEFVPSELAAEPVTFLTVNAAVAETRDEATALILPNLHMMARLRTGQPLGPVELVEDIRGT